MMRLAISHARPFPPLAVLLAALVAAGCSKGPPEPPKPPRTLVLVTIDTLRADHLSVYGYPRQTAPFLASLASRSVVFDRAVAASSHTGPSHASLFTGLYPAQHRLLENGQELDERVVTLAAVLRRQGYETGAFTTVRFLQGLDRGFDHFSAQDGYRSADVILGAARAWLESRPPEGRAFVWVHLFDVHQWYLDEFLRGDLVAEWAREEPAARAAVKRHLEDRLGGAGASGSQLERAVEQALGMADRYDAQMLSMDAELARFHRFFGQSGRLADSLWVVTADHGEGLGSHGYAGHGKHVYNEQLRVPLLVYAPDGRFAPRRVGALVRGVDLAPTLAAVAGDAWTVQALPVQGRSLVPLLHGEEGWQGRPAFSQRRPVDEKRRREGWAEGEVFALQSEALKVIVGPGGAEVFDLDDDPHELRDLAGGEAPLEGEAARLLAGAESLFRRLSAQGEQLRQGEINPAYVEELRALGYL